MITKNELIAKYAESYGITKVLAKQNIEEVLDVMQKAVIEDGGVDIYGFMKIEKVLKPASTARNPKTGEEIPVPEKFVPKAKFSKRFKDAVKA